MMNLAISIFEQFCKKKLIFQVERKFRAHNQVQSISLFLFEQKNTFLSDNPVSNIYVQPSKLFV